MHVRSTFLKVAASVAVIASIGFAGIAAASAASGSTAPPRLVDGTLSLSIDGAPVDGSGIALDASNMAPGDAVEQTITLRNTGTIELDISIETMASTSSLLDTDTVNGLHLQVDVCARRWQVSRGSSSHLTCPSAQRTLVRPTPVMSVTGPLSDLASASASGSDHLRVRLVLPTSGQRIPGRTVATRARHHRDPAILNLPVD